jgi:hypothetical protein
MTSPEQAAEDRRRESDRAAYEDLSDALLRDPRVQPGRILSTEALTVHGQVFAFLSRGGLVVKVPRDVAVARLAEGASAAMVAGGRPLREWIVTGAERVGDWEQLMSEALDYVATLPPRPRRTRRPTARR